MTIADLSLQLNLIKANYKAAITALNTMAIHIANVEAEIAKLEKPEPEISILQLAKTPALSLVPVAPAVTVVPEPPKPNGTSEHLCKVCGGRLMGQVAPIDSATVWRVWFCAKCKVVRVDPFKLLRNGVNLTPLPGTDTRQEITFTYDEWDTFKEWDQAHQISKRFYTQPYVKPDPQPDGGKAWIAAKPTKKVEVTPMEEEKLILNDEWIKVLELLNNGNEHIFLTGEGGTGKSTLLQHYVSHCRKNVAVVAPTGVAALRAGGMTLHSFFRFGAHAYENDDVQRISDDKWRAKYEKLDELIIDEASMVRADIMDAVEKHLRVNGPRPGRPFGGVRLILIGDLYQLPPVSKERDEKKYLISRYGIDCPMFFHAECFRDNPPKIVELTTVFRQKDPAFMAALNAIRRGTVLPEHLTLINSRVDPKFVPPVKGEPWLILTPRNEEVEKANLKMMASLPGPARTFDAVVSGDFNLKDAPTYEHLELKPGAIVMFVRNNPEGGWVNGTMGKVVSVEPLIVEANGDEHEVEPETWERIVYEFDEKKKKLTRNIAGKYTQIPLKPAAALTIHKSQGTSLDRGIIDLGSGAFASGQAYVAVSRFRSLEGIVLRKPLKESDLLTSQEVVNFMTGKPIARPGNVNGQLTLAV